MKPFSQHSSMGKRIMSWIQNYNHEKYWKRRAKLIDPFDNSPLLLKLYYLYYIKKTDARHNCSMGTNLNAGAKFASPPNLPHGLNGIIIGHDVTVGSNATIYQQVTIAHGGVFRLVTTS